MCVCVCVCVCVCASNTSKKFIFNFILFYEDCLLVPSIYGIIYLCGGFAIAFTMCTLSQTATHPMNDVIVAISVKLTYSPE